MSEKAEESDPIAAPDAATTVAEGATMSPFVELEVATPVMIDAAVAAATPVVESGGC